MINRICKCEDFKEYMSRIGGIVSLHAIRTGNKYPLGDDFKFIKYCPWCGKELQEEV